MGSIPEFAMPIAQSVQPAPPAMVPIATPYGPRLVPAAIAAKLAQQAAANSQPVSPEDQRLLESHLRVAYGASPDLAQRWAANIVANPNSPDRPLLDKARAAARPLKSRADLAAIDYGGATDAGAGPAFNAVRQVDIPRQMGVALPSASPALAVQQITAKLMGGG